MRLARLIYASRATNPMGAGDMAALLDAASEFNRGIGITGMLAFDQASFLQVLEGGAQSVNSLYNRIARDPRHRHLTLLAYGEVVEREFADWGMVSFDICGMSASARAVTMRKYRETPWFDPFSMQAGSALSLLRALNIEVLPACVDSSLERDAIA